MSIPGVLARRLWPLLVVLNSSACSNGGWACDQANTASTTVPASDFLSSAPSPMEYCCDENTPFPVTVGTIRFSLTTDAEDTSFHVRPRPAPVQLLVGGIPLDAGEEIEVRNHESVEVEVRVFECVHTVLEFDIFRYAEGDSNHPDRTLGSFVRTVEIVPTDCNARTVVCAFTEAVTAVIHQSQSVIGVAGQKCWKILDGTTYATLSDKGSQQGNASPDYYSVDTVISAPGTPSLASASAPVEAAIAVGPEGAYLTHWLPETSEFGATNLVALNQNVTDFCPYNGPGSSGGVMANYTTGNIDFLGFDAGTGFFTITEQISKFRLTAAPGKAVSAATTGPVEDLFIVTEGTPGTLLVHHPADRPDGQAVKIGDVEDNPRRLRIFGNLLVNSNFGSDSLTVTRLDTLAIVGHTAVGDGPVGIDGKVLANGDIAVLSTGFNDNTYTITVFTTAGVVVSSETKPVPDGGLAPGHAIFHKDGVLISCHDSSEIIFIPATGPS